MTAEVEVETTEPAQRTFWLRNKQYTMFDGGMLAAKWLLECGCVEFRPDNPFEFRSGRKSPMYVDVRKVLGNPRARVEINMMSYNKIFEDMGGDRTQIIAGGESAGIPFATMIADRINKPLCYVRKAPKGYGQNASIEGLTVEQLSQGKHMLLVEDLTSEGVSKMGFIDAIRRSGNIITEVFSVFSYGCFGATETLASEGVRLIALATGQMLVDVADDIEWSTPEIRAEVRRFLANPDGWGGGVQTIAPELPVPETEAPGTGLPTHSRVEGTSSV